MTLADLEAVFVSVSAERTHHKDQDLGIVACAEALAAARSGNYGVGAVLVDPKWSCPGLVDTWVRLPPLPVRAAARTPAG